MSRGSYPILLLLAMSLPGAARAIGLGEIHVDSALNEPLTAQIDIVGATKDDLAVLTAKVANREVFLRYGADRPSFLTTASFKVGLNAQGHPVLNVRSTEAFTDPVVSFLVDLHYNSGELIREYSLLLDPAGFAQARAEAATAAAAQTTAAAAPASISTVSTTPIARPAMFAVSAADTPIRQHHSAAAAGTGPTELSPSGAHYRVTAKDTLRGIARHVGARTESQAQRLMLAIFRANPDAFDGNINLLHLGAVLSIPSAETADGIDATEARKEVRAQMTAWRLDGRPTLSRRAALPAAAPAAPSAEVPHTPALTAPAPVAAQATGSDTTTDALKSRVASLEQALDAMRQQVAQLTGHTTAATTPSAPQTVAPAAASHTAAPQAPAPQVQVMREVAPVAATPAVTAGANGTASAGHGTLLGAVGASLALLVGGFAFMRRRASRGKAQLADVFTTTPADVARAATVVAAVSKPDAAAQPKPAQSQRITVREIPDPPIVGEIKQRELAEDSDQNLFVDTEALERSYLDSLGIDTHGDEPHTAEHQIPEELLSELAESTQELPGTEAALHDTATLQQTDSFETLTREISTEFMRDATGSREATGLDTVAIDAADLEAELRDADPNTVVLDTLKVSSEDSEDHDETDEELPPAPISHPLPPRVSLTGSNPIAIDATPPGVTALDYNLLDLDATAQHVQMPSELNDHVVVSERRTNLIDVLRQAIDRDPHRRDLRMKLLETYYGAASMNQRAFLEVVRKLARDRDFLSGDDWKKVMMMGRDIAAEDILFADPVKDDDLADCA